jgi:hypothetical protein
MNVIIGAMMKITYNSMHWNKVKFARLLHVTIEKVNNK